MTLFARTMLLVAALLGTACSSTPPAALRERVAEPAARDPERQPEPAPKRAAAERRALTCALDAKTLAVFDACLNADAAQRR